MRLVSIWIVRCALVLACIVGIVFAARWSPYMFFWMHKPALSVYMWADQIDEEVITQFEEETGIKVYVTYYESNEELLTKLEVGKFPECDLMTPSAYMIPDLKKAGLIQEIDWSQLNFKKDICPQFLDSVYDPGNKHSIPLYWDFHVLAYDNEVYPDGFKNPSWAMAFEKASVPAEYIGMIDDARESICLAMLYLGYEPEGKLNKQQIDTILQTFIRQRKWVGGYSDAQQGYYIASKTYPFVVTQREYLARERIDYDYIDAVVPEEGTLMTLYNFVLTSTTKHKQWAYQLLNFLYKKEVMLHHAQEFRVIPVTKSALKQVPDEWLGIPGMKPWQKGFSKIIHFPKMLTQKQINDIWIKTRSS